MKLVHFTTKGGLFLKNGYKSQKPIPFGLGFFLSYNFFILLIAQNGFQ